jgi:hypothetical protein
MLAADFCCMSGGRIRKNSVRATSPVLKSHDSSYVNLKTRKPFNASLSKGRFCRRQGKHMADTESNENAGPRKGLWALMGQQPDKAESADPPLAEPATPLTDNAPVTANVPQSDAGKHRKGLWSLMQQAGPTADATTVPEAPQDSANSDRLKGQRAFEAPVKGADKRLRQLKNAEQSRRDDEMLLGSVEDEPLEDSASDIEPADEEAAVNPLPAIPTATKRELPAAGLKPAVRAIPAIVSRPTPRATPAAAALSTGDSRSAKLSVILGGLSLPISLIAIWPAIWTRIPPSICGFVALLLGFLGLSEIQKSRGRIRGKSAAFAGMGMGLLGMFAGPMIYSPLDLYGSFSDSFTGGHLKQISLATEAYYSTEHTYPVGGIFHIPKPGVSEPMHGWMTQILPHLPDGAALFRNIDLEQPYFASVNQPSMGHLVPSFLAAGGNRSLIQDKFGPAHFAGLGGVITQDDGSIAHVGVFDVNSDVTRDDVTDGQSHTMLMGEIGHDYPAWGEPRNWRQIGKGLNRDPNGFGNARHTGAMFLMADGSVKFFPNQTDPKVLQALSTRDGDEHIPSSGF